MTQRSSIRLFSIPLLGLPILLSACSGSAPSKEEVAKLEASLLNQPVNMLLWRTRTDQQLDVDDIKVVKYSCQVVKDFDSAFDCTVSFTLNDEPQKNTLRAIHHEDGKWRLAKEQPN